MGQVVFSKDDCVNTYPVSHVFVLKCDVDAPPSRGGKLCPPLLLGGTMKTAEVMPGECQGCHKRQYNFRLVLWGGLLTEPNWCIEETLNQCPRRWSQLTAASIAGCVAESSHDSSA